MSTKISENDTSPATKTPENVTERIAADAITAATNIIIDNVIAQFPHAPPSLVESEKAKGLVSPSWDGNLETLTNHVQPCPMCGSTCPPISGCGYCH